MALVENPRSTRGVLFELSRLASSETFSPPLESALGGSAPVSRPAFALASIPAVLSRAQKRVLEAAGRHPLTLIVGPPGTGKSYTVTALALEHLARGASVLVACRTEQWDRPRPRAVPHAQARRALGVSVVFRVLGVERVLLPYRPVARRSSA